MIAADIPRHPAPVAPGAAEQRLRRMLDGLSVDEDTLRLTVLAVECAASQAATARLCAEPLLQQVAADADRLARELLRDIGIVSIDIPLTLLCQRLDG